MRRETTKFSLVSALAASGLSAVSLGLVIGMTVAWRQGYAGLPPCACPPGVAATPEVVLGRLRQVIERPSDEAAGEIAKQLQPSLAAVYRRRASAADDFIGQVWPEADYLGGAIILTTDGWLVTPRAVAGDAGAEQLTVVVADGSRYPGQARLDDAATNLAYLRIGATNLQPAPFSVLERLASGQTVVALSSRGEVVPSHISAVRYVRPTDGAAALESSERVQPRVALRPGVMGDFAGGAVADLDGGLVGVIVAPGSPAAPAGVLPMAVVQPSLQRFVQTQRVAHAYLGVRYLDLAHVVGLSAIRTAGHQRGALIVEPPSPGGPAAFANLLPGDIVTKVDGFPVDADVSLAERILDLAPGDRITLEVSRQGKTLRVPIWLGGLP